MSDSEERLIRAIKTELDRSAETLDGPTLARLAQARRQALRPRSWRQRLWPGSALAAATALLMLWLALPAAAPNAPLEDLEVLTATDGVEFYDELEFYEWLEQQDLAG